MADTNRLFPKRARTNELIERLLHSPVRTCRTMHECCLCDVPIRHGDGYRDAGVMIRAHLSCVNPGACA